MDPLVACALYAQRGIARGLGTAIALFGGALLVAAPSSWLRYPFNAVLIAGLGVSLSWRAFSRFKRLDATKSQRREVEIAVHLMVLGYAVIEQLPGQLAGAYQPLVYLLIMCVAGFFCGRASIAALLTAVLLELGLGVHRAELSMQSVIVHSVLLGVFAAVNWAVFRGEIKRVRRLSRERIESELLRIKEAARDYRLTGVPRSAADGASLRVSAPQGDDDRLLHSSLDHLQDSLRFMLFLLRRSLGARTAALVWLDGDGKRLVLREASSEFPELLAGPFASKDGVFGACLSSGGAVTLSPGAAARALPIYPPGVACAAVVAVPISDRGGATGVLLVEGQLDGDAARLTEALLSDAAAFASRIVENERLFLSLERAKTEQGKLYQAADLLADARSEVAVIRAGVESARQFAQFDFAAVTLFEREGRWHEICAVSGEGADALVGAKFQQNNGLVSMVVANQHPLPYRGQLQRATQVVFSKQLPLPPMPSLLVLPLKVYDTPLGTLVLGSNTPHAFGDAVRPTLEVLARHIAVSLANARMVKRLEDLATTDSMTQLLNKRALLEIAEQKIRSAQRFKKPLSLIIGDIDLFKAVNDDYGHDVGDVVIRGFGDVLRRSKRETDSVGRFGGEEFVIVCEETDAEGAQLLAERIRTEFAAVTFHTEKGELRKTCSLGIATMSQAGSDWESLFKSADEALYVSKRSGRDRVTVWRASMKGVAA